jgi:hypothetical protein
MLQQKLQFETLQLRTGQVAGPTANSRVRGMRIIGLPET